MHHIVIVYFPRDFRCTVLPVRASILTKSGLETSEEWSVHILDANRSALSSVRIL